LTKTERLPGESRGDSRLDNSETELKMPTQKPILLADDSEDDQVLFKRAIRLAALHEQVVAVSDGAQAIAYLKGAGPYADRDKHPLPRMVVLDLRMPQKTGFEVLQWIKTQPELAGIPVVVIAGTERPDDLKRSYELGAKAFLTKPCKPQELKQLTDEFKDN